MKTKNPGPSINRFKSAADRIAEKKAAAEVKLGDVLDVVHDARELTDEDRQNLREGSRMGDEGAKKDLKLIRDSFDALHMDPFIRRLNLRLAIKEFANELCPDPVRWLKLFFTGKGRSIKIRDSEERAPALPLFVRQGNVPREEVVNFPVRFEQRETIFVSLTREPVVAAEKEDLPALRAIIAQYKRLRELTEIRLRTEFLWNPREAVSQAAIFLPGAVLSQKELAAQFEPVEEIGLYKKRQSEEFYRSFKLSPEEIFLLQESDTAEELIAGLECISRIWGGFWDADQDAFDVVESVRPQLERFLESVITPTEFLAGKPGFTSVKLDAWKEEGTTIPVVLYLHRLGEEFGAAWRWVFANDEAVNALFGGKQLKYHNFSTAAVPNAVKAILTRGTVVLPPSVEEVKEP